MFSFAWPWLFLLLPLPWLVRRFSPAMQVQRPALRVPFLDRLEQLDAESRAPLQRNRGLLGLWLIWLLLVTAAAQPQWVGEPVSLPASGRDLLLAVDISRSMASDDMPSRHGNTRLDAVKDVVSDFVEQRKGDRLGLILFGERAYLQTPLTFDRHTVQVQLQEALPGFAGNATALGDAIGAAIKRLQDRDENSRVLILLTDGANTAGSDPLQAAAMAAQARLRIHTIGVGADPQDSLFGAFFGARSDLDEPTLKAIADNTGGRYFRARDPQELAQVYDAINQLEPVPEARTYRPRHALFYWPLTAALLLSWLLPLLANLRLPTRTADTSDTKAGEQP